MEMRSKIQVITSNWRFESIVICAILLNAITLGLETYPPIVVKYGSTMLWIDLFFILFFITELTLRITALGRNFFREGWNCFDLGIVSLTLLPFLGISGLGNVSAFRAMRLLRLLSAVPTFRRVLRGIGRALSGSVAVMCVLVVILYVYSVIAVKMFRDTSPIQFADLDTAFFTFFQIMTLDAWSDIVRPIMSEHWWAGLFFGSFIISTVFVLLSILIGIASNAMQE